jgi:phytoene dehydrogenase-like protein
MNTASRSVSNSSPTPIVVIGGGIAGLVAAAQSARAGARTVLVEKSSHVGGRAITRERHRFLFNLGPHALYRSGELNKTLKTLGIEVHGALPPTNGGYALNRGRLHTLPVGVASLLTTGLLGIGGKLEIARIQTTLPKADASALQRQTLADWLDTNVSHADARAVLEMLVRVSTFTDDPERQSAGAAIEQLQLALAGSVLYLDGGWQTIVNGLRSAAAKGGVTIVENAHVVGLERRTDDHVDGVRLADGNVIRAAAAIVTGSPAEVNAVIGERVDAGVTSPVTVSTLDVALSSLPRPRATVAFGVDEPLYFSVHSAVARLGPEGGALIHVSKYISPGSPAASEAELERLLDLLQPGWRERIVARQYLPNLTVAHAELTAAGGGTVGRPSPRVDAFDNVFIAGDWVGTRGQLSDAAAASGNDAAAWAIRPAARHVA